MAKEDTDLVLKFRAEQINLEKQVDMLIKKLDKLEGKTEKTGKTAKTMGDRMSAGFKKASSAAVNFGKKMLKVGVAMGAAGIVGAFVKGIAAASSFEKRMTEVATLLGKEAEPKMRKFNKAVREMAKTTSASADELASGLYQVISAGTEGTEDAAGAMRVLDAANKMAVAGVSDVRSAVDVLTTALNAWGASADEAEQFSDQMFKAIELGKLTLPDLSAGLGTVASAAAGAGLEFGEVNAALAAMTAAGVPPARAMTSLNAIIRVASKGSKELNEAFEGNVSTILREGGLLAVMEKLQEVTGGDTIALQQLKIEQEAVTGLAVLAGTGIDKFRSSLEKMTEAAGSTESAYKKMTETFEFQKKRFWNVLNDMLIDIGTDLMPQILEGMEDIAAWVMANGPAIRGFFQDVLTLLKGIAAVIKDIVEGLQTAAGMASILGKGQSDIEKAVAAARARAKAAEAAGEAEELGGISGAELFGFGIPTAGAKGGKPPPGKRRKLLPEDIRGIGGPFGAGFMAAGVAEVIERAGASAGFALVDAVNERRAEVLKFAEDFAADSVDAWYQKIGGPELETIEERRAFAFSESLAKVQSKPGFWDDVATGFAESLGERLENIMVDIAGVLLKPAGQIGDLLGMAMGGADVGDVRAQTEQMVQFWEQLAENIGPVLDYLIEEGIPMILDAFIEHIPDIIDAITEAVPEIIETVIKHIPKIITALVEGIIKAFGNLLGIGGGPSVGGVITGAGTGAGIGAAVGSIIPGVGTGVGAAIGAGVGFIASLFHEGGFVEAVGGVSKSANVFAKAIKAHAGLFVKPGLAAGEVPTILEAGEGVIRKEVVAAMGGEPFVNALNQGRAGGSGDTHVHLHTEHLYASDAAEIVDDLQSEMLRRGTGRMRHLVGGSGVPGYRPLRRS